MTNQQSGLPNPIAAITDVLSVVTTTVSRVINLLGDTHIPQAISHMVNLSTGALQHVPKDVTNPAHWYTDFTTDMGTPFVEAFLRGGLGVNPDYNGGKFQFPTKGEIAKWKGSSKPFESDTSQGIDELKRLVGFAMLMPFVWEGIQLLLKLPLADRIPDSVGETIGKIPTEMGISWALGMAMSSIFETAAGRQIEELVNVQLHPNRLDMMTLRAMARQHRITEEQFWAGLDLLGYPDALKSLILEMDTQQLPITDLQALYVYGQISREDIKLYLENIGFSDPDITKLLTVYVDKAETQASSMFRTELRTAFLEYRISKIQFKAGLAQLLHNPQVAPVLTGDVSGHYDNAPEQVKMVVDLEAAALDFQLAHGRRMQSVATLKTLYQTKHLTLHELEKRLTQQGYSSEDANQLISTWTNQGVPGKPGLTSAKVISYAASGTLTRQEALARLQDLGVNLKDAVFLVDNPTAKTGPYYPPFSESSVVQAFTDGALSFDGAIAALERLKFSAEAAREIMTIALYTQQHATSPLTLTVPQLYPGETKKQYEQLYAGYLQAETFEKAIKTQFMAKVISDSQTITMLESLGLSQNDAGFVWYSWSIERDGKPPGAPA